jgi:hypothetical protein
MTDVYVAPHGNETISDVLEWISADCSGIYIIDKEGKEKANMPGQIIYNTKYISDTINIGSGIKLNMMNDDVFVEFWKVGDNMEAHVTGNNLFEEVDHKCKSWKHDAKKSDPYIDENPFTNGPF